VTEFVMVVKHHLKGRGFEC